MRPLPCHFSHRSLMEQHCLFVFQPLESIKFSTTPITKDRGRNPCSRDGLCSPWRSDTAAKRKGDAFLLQPIGTSVCRLLYQRKGRWQFPRLTLWPNNVNTSVLPCAGICFAVHIGWRGLRRHQPAPAYQLGQRVWHSTKDLQKFCLRLPWSLRTHPTFHVSQVKMVKESSIVPTTRSYPLL